MEHPRQEGGEAALSTSTQPDLDDVAEVAFRILPAKSRNTSSTCREAVQYRRVPVHNVTLADGSLAKVATVFDLSAATLAIDRGWGPHVAKDYDDASVPGTPACRKRHRREPREAIQIAREFADNADKTLAVDDHRRRGDEPLVPHGHELPRLITCSCSAVVSARPAAAGPLRRPGKTASAMWLAAPGVWPGLEPPATPDERHEFLLRPQFAVAPRENEHARRALAAGRQVAVPGTRPGLQHPRRTRRLVAQRATTQYQPVAYLP